MLRSISVLLCKIGFHKKWPASDGCERIGCRDYMSTQDWAEELHLKSAYTRALRNKSG